MKILEVIGILLSILCVVAYFWGGFHSYHYLTFDKAIILLVVGFLGALTGAITCTRRAFFCKYFITPMGLIVSVSVMAGLVGVLLIKLQGLEIINGLIFSSYMGHSSLPAEQFSIVFSFLVISLRTLLKVFVVYFLISVYGSVGRYFVRKISTKDMVADCPYLDLIICTAIGLSLHGFILVSLAVFGYLNIFTTWLTLIFFLLLGLWSREERRALWRALFLPISGFNLPIFSLLVTWLSLNLLNITRPIPTGFDDMNVYINYGKNLFESGGLPIGFGMRFWEIFTSQGFYLFGSTANAELAIFFSFFGGFLALFALYLLLKHFWPEDCTRPGLFVLLFYTTPMIFFQMAKDMKPDVTLTFLFIAALCVFLIFFERVRNPNQELVPYLFILNLFLGLSFSLKYTAAFFIIPIVVLVAIMLRKNGGYSKMIVLASIVGFIIPFLPWILKSFEEEGTLRLGSVLSWQQPGGPHVLAMEQLAVKYPEYSAELVPGQNVIIGSGYNEEVERYVGYEDGFVNRFLLRPWYAHLNNKIQGPYIDMGFIWLAGLALFLPIIYFFLKDKRFLTLGVMASMYWTLWIFIGRGIPWYGMSGFILILLLFGWWHEQSQKISKAVYGFFIVISVLWLIIVTLTELTVVFSPFTLGYASGYLDSSNTKDQMVSWYYAIGEEVNKNSSTPIHPDYVYRMGTMVPYFIKKDFTRVYNDSLLETFTPLNSEGDQYLTTLRLALLGFRYIVVDLNLPSIDQTPNKTLAQKVERLEKYIDGNKYLIERIYNEKGGVIFLEIDPKLTALYRQN